MPIWLRALVFVSGASALVYQLLWMRALSLRCGSTAAALAATVAVFFIGLAIGGQLGGMRARRSPRPLADYGLLEFAIALAAAWVFWWFGAYPWSEQSPESADDVGAALRVSWVFLPATIGMGATLPLLVEHLARREPGSAQRAAADCYTYNTLGAAVGAYLTGFHALELAGFTNVARFAVATSFGLGVIACLGAWTSGRARLHPAAAPSEPPTEPTNQAPSTATRSALAWPRARYLALAAWTGFATLALEVLWTHLFAQVLQNSVYTFAAILVTFLAALGAGAWSAARLLAAGAALQPARSLGLLLSAGGLAVVTSLPVFFAWTDDLRYLEHGSDFFGYVCEVFLAVGVVVVPSTLLLGAALPMTLGLAQREARLGSAGATVGRIVAINTAAAVLGSLAAGFWMMATLGTLPSVWLIGVTSLVVGAAFWGRPRGAQQWSLAGGAVLLCLVLHPFGAPLVEARRGEAIVEAREGRSGFVAVMRDGDGLRMRVDNWYTLGGSGARRAERRQAQLAMALVPDARSVFVIGLGTGITAGATLDFPIERVLACEVIGDVVELAERHFAPWNGGLFGDPRAEVAVADGRRRLARADERFDVILADLFVPWRRGIASVYSREHFTNALRRLDPAGGIFAQWIAAYQVSAREFGVIARTMLEVFPRVTLWRGDFGLRRPKLMLVGHASREPLDPDAIDAWLRAVDRDVGASDDARPRDVEALLRFYCVDLTAARAAFAEYPLHTDDRPILEFEAPRTHRAVRSGRASWLVGEALLDAIDAWSALAGGIENETFLARLSEAQRAAVRDGYRSHHSGAR